MSTTTDPNATPPTDPNATTTPPTDPNAVNTPPTDPNATTTPPTDPNAVTTPPTDPNAVNTPPTDPNAVTTPPTDPNAVTTPPTDPNAVNTPPTDPNAVTTPPTDPNAVNTPPTDPNAVTTPPTDPNAVNTPPTDPNAAPPTDPNAVTTPPTDPNPNDNIIIDPTPSAAAYVPPTNVTTTPAGVSYHYSNEYQAIVIDGCKDLELLKLTVSPYTHDVSQSWTENRLTLSPLTEEAFGSISLALKVFTNPDLPNVFGTNFSTAFVNNTVEISSGTAYVSAPTLNMNIQKAGLYAVHWYVEVLIPDGGVEVLVLANGSTALSRTTYGQSNDTNDWRTVSGFAVQAFPAGTAAGVKLAYKYVDISGNQTMPTTSSTARNAKLMVYQVGRV